MVSQKIVKFYDNYKRGLFLPASRFFIPPGGLIFETKKNESLRKKYEKANIFASFTVFVYSIPSGSIFKKSRI